MKIKPLGKRILIQRSKPPTHKGGLLLPEASQQIKNEGTVIAIGCDVMEIDIDDIVMFAPYTGTPVKCDDDDMLIISETDVLGVIYD